MINADIDRRFALAHSQLQTIAVTGTNGKTTTVSMVDSIVRASGEPNALLTTLGASVAGSSITAPNASLEFLCTVETAVSRKARTLALEVTSKALAAGLARRWPANIAVFTNLTRDHLDMHGSAEHYLASKAQLFMLLTEGGVAVLNGEDESAELIEAVIQPGRRIRRFAARGSVAELSAGRVDVSAAGTLINLHDSPLATEFNGALKLSVVGRVHAENALGAALAADSAGYSPEVIALGLRSFRGVRGRFEIVGANPCVVVDYAHTPDGLRGTLETARELVGESGRLVCLFGCGGDRDRGKRPLMAQAVQKAADLVVLTSDNPRFEDPESIVRDVLAGVSQGRERWHVEIDRREAIRWMVGTAKPGDVLIIAGKGHEVVQEIRGVEIPLDDAKVAREAIQSGVRLGKFERAKRKFGND